MTDAPRSHSPDVELGTQIPQLGFVILRPPHIVFYINLRLLTATPRPTRVTTQPSTVPASSSYLPSYSYDAFHHVKVQSHTDPSRLPYSPPLSAVPTTDAPAGVAHPNSAEGNYGDPSDQLFSVYLAQADKFDKEQSESWKGDTEGILVFVCRRATLDLVPLTTLKYIRQVSFLPQ